MLVPDAKMLVHKSELLLCVISDWYLALYWCRAVDCLLPLRYFLRKIEGDSARRVAFPYEPSEISDREKNGASTKSAKNGARAKRSRVLLSPHFPRVPNVKLLLAASRGLIFRSARTGTLATQPNMTAELKSYKDHCRLSSSRPPPSYSCLQATNCLKSLIYKKATV